MWPQPGIPLKKERKKLTLVYFLMREEKETHSLLRMFSVFYAEWT